MTIIIMINGTSIYVHKKFLMLNLPFSKYFILKLEQSPVAPRTWVLMSTYIVKHRFDDE